MRKQNQKKLSLNRETVRQLATDNLTGVKGAAAIVKVSNEPPCEPTCPSTLSCTQ